MGGAEPAILQSVLPLVATAATTSAVATWLAIGYAHRRRLFDLPGRRRSHRSPTPRGGGIGIPLALIACTVAGIASLPELLQPSARAPAMLVAALLVAVAGWVDDHGGLAARWRLLAHLAAAALLLVAGPGAPLLAPLATAAALALGLLLAVGIAWWINLHNFMDGIDGLLATQALFVLGVLAWLLQRPGAPPGAAAWTAAFAAAGAGFLPFNFPRARIFMGDVGSGVLGLLVAVALLWQLATPSIAAASGLVLCSAFATDATCTLLSRMLRGRRWYSAHREHLYQWLVRCGWSHARVVALYGGWNLLVVLPLVTWMNHSPTLVDNSIPPAGAGALVLAYGLAAAGWWGGKRWCMAHARRERHALA